MLQPLVVRKHGVGYQIIVGERRWRAAQLAGLRSVPALLHDTDDTHVLELALVENIHREDLNPLEEAWAYQMMVDRLALTQEEIAARVGRDRSTVANTLRLLKLHDDVKKHLLEGRIEMGHARALLAMEDPIGQRELCAEVITRGLNVRQVEQRVKALQGDRKKRARAKPSPFIRDAEDRLSGHLQAKVAIRSGARGGRIEIRFNSDKELERLFELLMNE
jgi:ParB family chromosome partitioning protein